MSIFRGLTSLAAFAGTVAAALYRDRAAHAEEREDAAHDLVSEAIADKQKAWTELGLMRDRAERAELDLTVAKAEYQRRAVADADVARRLDAMITQGGQDAIDAHAQLIAARTRIAELEQASAPVEPAAVDAVPVKKYPPDAACTWCGKPAGSDWHKRGRWVYEDLMSEATDDLLPVCAVDYDVVPNDAIRARYAARAAQTVATAVEPAQDIRVENGPKYERVGASDEGPWTVSFKLRCGRTQLGNFESCRTATKKELNDPTIWLPIEAPTQDDLDDAAVRELLARGPATWTQVAAALRAVSPSGLWGRTNAAIGKRGMSFTGASLPTAAPSAPEAGK